MKAMILKQIYNLAENPGPLELTDLPVPVPEENEILVKISACGVCHTELDEIEGRTPPPKFPVIPGHQIVGIVGSKGKNADKFELGERVGIGWIHSSCGKCRFCLEGNDNLCEKFEATGRDAHGGYAEYTVVSENFAFKIPDCFSDAEAAPLLCAGAIGYRSLAFANIKNGENLGLTGFGASAHIVIQMAGYRYPDSKIFVFARNQKQREFATGLGAYWTGDIPDKPPEKMHGIIDTTPAWKPVLEALKNLERGGRLVINAIGKEDIDKEVLLELDYHDHLWLEKEIKSVANVASRDISEFLQMAAEIRIKPEVQKYGLEDANRALLDLKQSKGQGAKVLSIN